MQHFCCNSLGNFEYKKNNKEILNFKIDSRDVYFEIIILYSTIK